MTAADRPLCLADAKRAARRTARAARARCDPRAGAALIAHVRPPPGVIVAGFWPIGDEIDVRPLLATLHAKGHTLALPETPRHGATLGFHRWRPGDALQGETFGTWRPVAEDPVVPTYLLVPLLAFDRAGRRLGAGGGFYDRTLPALGARGATWLGVGYAAQEQARVPAGPGDVRLPAVATEHGLIVCEPAMAG